MKFIVTMLISHQHLGGIMKKLSILLAVVMVLSIFTGCSGSGKNDEPAKTENGQVKVDNKGDGGGANSEQATAGVIWYNFADTFISNARQTLNNISASDGTIKVTDADSQNDTTVQDNNITNILTQKPNYVVLNNINIAATSQIVQKFKDEGVTAIFANTSSPSDEDFANYENLWCVSSASEQSGLNMGEQIVKYLKSNPNWDRNGNGKVDFVLLQGIPTFIDTINRSSFSLQAIEEAGFTLGTNIGGDDVSGVRGGDAINGVICEFQRSKAQENVEALLASYGNDIDCILADNDDEALGAIAALQAHGYFSGDDNFIPVVGVDATAAGCEAIKDGTMLGTSLNNPVKLAKSIYKVMYLLSTGQEVTTETISIDGVKVEGHKVIIDYVSITKDNLDDASYDINDTNF